MMMFVVWLLIALLCGRLSAQQRSIRKEYGSNDQISFNTAEICSDIRYILYMQREQWTRAREDLFSNKQSGFMDDDMDFYKRSFGVVEVTLLNKKSFSELSYYRIYKSGNDNIRSLLSQLAYMLDNELSLFNAQNCYKDNCVHHRLHYKPPAAIKAFYISQYAKRFAFTFVREPIHRFMSAMTEIEYRAQKLLERDPNRFVLPFQQPLGSTLRVQEFIRSILLSDASKVLFKNKNMEMMHIVPMIGTLLAAHRVEGKPLRLYKLEQFAEEWQRLSKDSKLPMLLDIYNNRTSKQWNYHPTSQDPYRTKLAAKEFLSFASADAHNR
jgi:hypothetical protein